MALPNYPITLNDALELTKLKLNWDSLSYQVWTDNELIGYLKEGCLLISRITGCVEKRLTQTGLELGTFDGSVYSINYVEAVTSNDKSLNKIEPKMFNKVSNSVGKPEYYWYYANSLIILPKPADFNTLSFNIYYSKLSDDVSDFKNAYIPYIIAYAMDMALTKDRRLDEAAKYASEYSSLLSIDPTQTKNLSDRKSEYRLKE